MNKDQAEELLNNQIEKLKKEYDDMCVKHGGHSEDLMKAFYFTQIAFVKTRMNLVEGQIGEITKIISRQVDLLSCMNNGK